VAFKGSLEMKNLLGGIPATTQRHAIQKKPELFTKTESFTMILITEKQFNDNKGNLAQLNQTPFTRVFVMYNQGNDNEVSYKVSGRLGGNNRLLVQNGTGRNAELRVGGIDGDIIGFAPGGLQSITLYLNDGDLNIFPIFKSYNSFRNVVSELIPKRNSGRAWYMSYAVGELSGQDLLTLSLSDAFASLNDDRTIGASWLVINNQTKQAVMVQAGNVILTNSLGQRYTNAGVERIIQIDMSSNGLGTFATEKTIGNYAVGPDGDTVTIKDKEGNTSFTLKADKQYVVTVTGDYNEENVTAVIDLDGAIDIDFDELDKGGEQLK
jgi:hypothetical protein